MDFGIEINNYSNIQLKNNAIFNNNLGIVLLAQSSNNSFRKNLIYCNNSDNINLEVGTNGNKKPPVITTLTSTFIQGNGDIGDTIEIFRNNNLECYNSYCHSKSFVGSVIVNNSGEWIFLLPYNIPLEFGEAYIATATKGNTTSSFSDCIQLGSYQVNTTDDEDDGICNSIHCSLREAINAANKDGIESEIEIQVPGIIRPLNRELPYLSEDNTVLNGNGIIIEKREGASYLYNYGISIGGGNCTIKNCYIRGFGEGIHVYSGGINADIINNTISGNILGIQCYARNIKIESNVFGLDSDGKTAYGNTNGAIQISFTSGPSNALVYKNIIAHNNVGISATDIVYSQNISFCNNSINIRRGGKLPYDAPIINLADLDEIQGTAQPNDIIEVFISDDSDCSGKPCQGKFFLGTTTTNNQGNWTLSAPYDTTLVIGTIQLTATATDGNRRTTSNFSSCFILTLGIDECIDAVDLPISTNPCNGIEVVANNLGATTSENNPITSNCGIAIEGGDIWFKATVPFSGNLFIKQSANSEIDAIIEAYKGTCGSLESIRCDSLFDGSNFILSEQDPNSTVYFRVWDKGNDNTGLVRLSAHYLEPDPLDWILCDRQGGAYIAGELIVQFDEGTTQDSIDNYFGNYFESLGLAGEKKDSCLCGPKPLYKWRANDPIDIEDRRQVSKERTNVDTTILNFVIGEIPCQGTGQISPLFPFNYTPIANANKVKIAIIDTGVEKEHGLLQNVLWNNENIGSSCVPNDSIGYDFIDDDGNPEDINGHGTGINGAIIRDFPNDIQLELMNLKVYGEKRGSMFDAICAIHYAIQQEADIINMSWGFERDSIPDFFAEVLNNVPESTLLVTSSGNVGLNNDSINKWPANYDLPNMIRVGAYEATPNGQNITLAHYSNYGSRTVDIAALGFVETTFLNNTVSPLAGTSLAAALVTRTASILKGKCPELSGSEIKQLILDAAQPISTLAGKVRSNGILNHNEAVSICSPENLTLSIEDLNKVSNEIQVYPNPAHQHQITLKTPHTINTNKFQLFDLRGKVVFQTILSPISNIHQIDLPKELKGFYIFSLSDANQIYSGKLVVY